MLTALGIIYCGGAVLLGIGARLSGEDGLTHKDELVISLLWPAVLIWFGMRWLLNRTG